MKSKLFVFNYKIMLYFVIALSTFVASCTQDSSNEEYSRNRWNWWNNNGGSSGGGTSTNKSPVVNAGTAQTITAPASSVTLKGSATDADGSISSYLWTKVSGPSGGNIASPNSATTNVTSLIVGTYVFNLKATDNKGATGNATVTITVKSATTTTPPPTTTNPPSTAGYTLVYQNGLNTMSDINNTNQYGNGTISTTNYVTGPGAFRSRPANVSAGIRSEVELSGSLYNPTEGAIEYDVRYDYVVKGYCHTLQWHPNTSGGSASPGLWHVGGKFVWYNWKNGGNTTYATNFTIPQGQWMHFRVEYKFGSSGYIRHYINNQLVLDKSNIQVGDGSGQYLKVGFNGGFDGNTNEAMKSDILYDNLKIYKKG